MNREIKFRAFDTKLKQWVAEGFTVIGEVSMFREVEGYCHENKAGAETTLERLFEIVLDQFTGLQDKNGVDIYEGDIVKSITMGDGLSKTEEVWVIYFGSWCYMRSKDLDHHNAFSFDAIYVRSNCEVIGNIHESPELIK